MSSPIISQLIALLQAPCDKYGGEERGEDLWHLATQAQSQWVALHTAYETLCDANQELRETLEKLNAEVEILRLQVQQEGAGRT